GTHHGPGQNLARRRFIPTCVGNTTGTSQKTRGSAVHPHMRGEHEAGGFAGFPPVGSSPHAWGTLATVETRQNRGRFIPTCVGNTLLVEDMIAAIPVHPHMRGEHKVFSSCCGGVSTVHPHMRGEHLRPGEEFFIELGSSPHAWGTPARRVLVRLSLRF